MVHRFESNYRLRYAASLLTRDISRKLVFMLDINGHDYSKAQDQTRLRKQRRPTDGITNLSILRFGWLRYLWLYLRTRVNRTPPELPEHAVASSLYLESCPPLKASPSANPAIVYSPIGIPCCETIARLPRRSSLPFSTRIMNAG